MEVRKRKGVDPVIGTLLLIAITVSAGIITYVFVNQLATNFTKPAAGQVTEQVTQDAYVFVAANATDSSAALSLTVRNSGTAGVTVGAWYYDGTPLTESSPYSHPYFISSTLTTTGCAPGQQLEVGETCTLGLQLAKGQTQSAVGTSVAVELVTEAGGTFTFNVIAGGSG